MRPALTESTLPTWTTVLAAPIATGGGGGGDGSGGDDDEDTLQRWSSLIGIITAIVGNVLIALALNVQRYAHTRLHKERKRIKQEARAALKRAQSRSSSNGSTQVGVYGTIIGDGAENEYQNGHSGTNGDRSDFSIPHYDDNSDDEHGDRDDQESEPLMASFQSSTTTASSDTDTKEDKKPSSNYLKSPYWWLGQILITLGEAGNFLAYGFAPASIVSPLGVVALVSNCIIAPAMFHEKFRPRDFWGVVIAVSGVVTVVLSANQQETKLNPHDVWGAITTMEFEIYLGVTTLLIIILMWASSKYGKRTILIDLGLVGLFGKLCSYSCFGNLLLTVALQEATQLWPPKVYRRCSPPAFWVLSQPPLHMHSYLSYYRLPLCRFAMSTRHYLASIPLKSSPSSSSCSHCVSSSAALCYTAISRRRPRNKLPSLWGAVSLPFLVSFSSRRGGNTEKKMTTKTGCLKPTE